LSVEQSGPAPEISPEALDEIAAVLVTAAERMAAEDRTREEKRP